jgi:rifampicin phosphotransferase
VSDLTGQPLLFSFGLGDAMPERIGVDVLGGKGASLAEMTRAGFPVPPGFTISTACCAWVDRHDGRWPDGLEQQVRAAMQRLEEATQRTFGRGPRPLFVAVRSGAAVSMPGMMDTILNCGLNPSVIDAFPSSDVFWTEYADHIRLFAASVAGLSVDHSLNRKPKASALSSSDSTDVSDSAEAFAFRLRLNEGDRQKNEAAGPETRARRSLAAYEAQTGRPFPTDPWESLTQSINAVFASWHSDRAKAYRRHHDVRGVVGTAVNVQAMFPSERSGVLFTAHPNDPASGEMIVEASWGLGEAVVSGAVTPDIYVLDAASLAVKRVVAGSRPADEPALSNTQLQEIAELGRKAESHFRFPCDIEWGIADGRVALLQSRKIRGLEIFEDAETGRIEEIARLGNLARHEPIAWVVHNLSETLPAPTPLTWDLVRWFMSAAGGYGRLYRLLGHRPREREAGCGFLELIAGRIYVDPRRAAEFHFGRLPFEYDVDEILRDRTVLDRPPSRFNLDRTDPWFFFRLPSLLIGMIRGTRQMRAMSRDARDRFESVAVPKLERFLLDSKRTDLRAMTTANLLLELHRRREYVLGEFAGESLLPGFFGGVAHEQLRHLLGQLFGPGDGEEWAGTLTTGLEGDVTVEQSMMLFEVASGRLTRDDFLARYGHRSINEMELSQPRWREEHSFVDRMIERFRDPAELSPRERHSQQVDARLQAERELPARLARAGGSSLKERVEQALRQAQQLLPYRELGKFHLMRGYETLRDLLVELGRRWDLGRDVFFLRFDELDRFETDRSATEQRIEQRKLRWRSVQKLILPDLIDSRRLDDFGRPRPRTELKGQSQLACRSIASGHARGMARIVFDPREAGDLGHDYVLVCPSTDPGWTPLFVHAKGLIVERGGVLSHGAIVARDFGIPAVVLEGATQLIADGSEIELDAHHGSVVLLSTGSAPNAESGHERVAVPLAGAR